MIELFDIPVVVKSPVTGYSLQTLLTNVTMEDSVNAPNGVIFLLFGDYSPGSQQDLFGMPDTGYLLRIHDFVVSPDTPIMAVVNVTVANVPATHHIESNLENLQKRLWDIFVVAFNLAEFPSYPISLNEGIESVRAALVTRTAILWN